MRHRRRHTGNRRRRQPLRTGVQQGGREWRALVKCIGQFNLKCTAERVGTGLTGENRGDGGAGSRAEGQLGDPPVLPGVREDRAASLAQERWGGDSSLLHQPSPALEHGGPGARGIGHWLLVGVGRGVKLCECGGALGVKADEGALVALQVRAGAAVAVAGVVGWVNSMSRG